MSVVTNISLLTTFNTSTSSLLPILHTYSPVWPPLIINDTADSAPPGLDSSPSSLAMFQHSLPQDFPPFSGFPSLIENAPQRIRNHQERSTRRRHVKPQRLYDDEPDKKRRSLNVPTNQKPRFSRLYVLGAKKTSSARVVEVQRDGSIVTTANVKSPQSILMVLFSCQFAPWLFKSCQDYDTKHLHPIFLRFEDSNRFICMNESGQIFTRQTKDISPEYDDCLFYHETFHSSDFYYSWKYPKHLDRCRSVDHVITTHQSGSDHNSTIDNKTITDTNSDKAKSNGSQSDILGNVFASRDAVKLNRTCANLWYMAVSREGDIRSVKTSTHHSSARFIQRWLHELSSTPLPGHDPITTRPGYELITSGSVTRTQPVSVVPWRTRKKNRTPAFGILSPSEDKTSRGNTKRLKTKCRNRDLSNLLMNLEDQRKCEEKNQRNNRQNKRKPKTKKSSEDLPFR